MNSPTRDERGSISTWLLLSVVGFLAIIGLSVDLGGRMYALQQVNDVAAQAARTGTQQVSVASTMRGQAPTVDPAKAKAAALGYIHGAGFTGTATVSGQTLHVTVRGTHTPVFLPGASTATVTGEAEARLVRALNGTEQ